VGGPNAMTWTRFQKITLTAFICLEVLIFLWLLAAGAADSKRGSGATPAIG
jgi:hypothetical protein